MLVALLFLLSTSPHSEATQGLLRLLLDPAPSSPTSCNQTFIGLLAPAKSQLCERAVCEAERPTDAPSIESEIAQIRGTPDPRTADERAASERVIDRAMAAKARGQRLLERSSQELVRQALRAGPQQVSRLLRSVSSHAFQIYPRLRNGGGVGVIYPTSLRQSPEALAAAESIARQLLPQMQGDLLANLYRPGFVPDGAVAQMRPFYTQLARTLPNGAQKDAAQRIASNLAGASTEESVGRAIGMAMEAGLDLPQAQLNCRGCESQLVTLLEYISDDLGTSADLTPERRQVTRDTLQSICQVAAWGDQHMKPTESELQQLNQLVQESWEQLSQNVFPHFSAHSQQLLLSSRASVGSALRLEGRVAPSVSELDRLVTNLPSSGDALEVFAIARSLANDAEEASCDVGLAVPGDHYSFVKNELNFSPWTIRRADRSVIAHELGHFISDVFLRPDMSASSSAKFRELRMCLTTPGGGPVAGGSFAGDGIRTEEDTADLIATLAGADMSRSMCGLLNSPVSILFGKGATANALRIEPDEPHSPTLWRVLHSKVMRGETLPAVCEEALAEVNTPAPVDCRAQLARPL